MGNRFPRVFPNIFIIIIWFLSLGFSPGPLGMLFIKNAGNLPKIMVLVNVLVKKTFEHVLVSVNMVNH